MVAVGDQVLLVAGAEQVFTVVEILDTQALVQSAEVYSGEDDEAARARWEGARYAFPTPLALLVPVDAG